MCVWSVVAAATLGAALLGGCGDDDPVAPAAAKVTMSGARDIEVGDIITLTAASDGANAPVFSWSTSDPAVVVVGTPGAAHVQVGGASAGGPVTIGVTDTANGNGSDSASVTVSAYSGGLAESSWPRTRADNGNTGQGAIATGGAFKGRPGGAPTKGGSVGFVATQAKLLWSCNLGGEAFIEGTPVVGEDGTVYLAVRTASGHPVCAVTPPAPPAPAAVEWSSTVDVALLTVGADGDIYCGSLGSGSGPGDNYYRLDSTNGSEVWGAPVSAGPGTHFTASGPGIGSDGTLYVSGSDGVLRAISPGGTVKWTLAVGNYLDGGPALGSDGRIYVAGVDTSDAAALFAVADETTAGSVKWTRVLPVVDGKTPIEAGSVVMGGNGQVYVAARDDENYGLFYSVIPGDTAPTPVYGCLTPIESFRFAVSRNMVAENGTLYSSFLALDAISPAGSLLWSTKLHTERRPVVLGDGTVVATLTDGRVVGFSPGTNHKSGQPAGTPIWQFQAGSHTTELAVRGDGTAAGTVIYFGSADGFLYAISPVPADVPCVVAAPSEITFSGSVLTGSTAAEPVRITNAGSDTLKWDITFEDTGGTPITTWLSAAQTTGTCVAGEWNETTVSVDISASGANPGDTLEAYVVITGVDNDTPTTDAADSPKKIHVTVYVGGDRYVDAASGNDAWNGFYATYTSGSDGPWKTLTHALTTAMTPGDVIHVADGTYDATGNGETFPFILSGQSIIGNAGDPSAVVIDPEGGARAFDMSSGLVRGVSIQNSVAPSPGPIEQDSYGGAINGQDLLVDRCEFVGNSAAIGGALFLWEGCRVTDSTFTGNTASDGGGAVYANVYDFLNPPRITGCVFDGNSTGDAAYPEPFLGGGAVYTCMGVAIEDCVFVANENTNANTGRGAAVYVTDLGKSSIVNSLFIGHDGAAVTVAVGHSLSLRNCTVTGNSVGVQVLALRPDTPDLGCLEVLDSVVYFNGGNSGADNDINTDGIDPAWGWITYSDVGPGVYAAASADHSAGTGNLSADPAFVEIASGPTADPADDHYLDQSGSPCVDAGSRTAAEAGLDGKTTDPAGSPAADSGTVDMGYHYLVP
ncbi:MAG: DUF1565 domain-containing protein [Planctomycetota bacterium]